MSSCSRGSPPHARGRPSQNRTQACWLGITPACAGKTSRSASRTGLSRDHPRMRGEDSTTASFRRLRSGSPPHARGRRRRWRGLLGGVGITPACAGKTDTTGFPVLSTEDHPRMRGEDMSGIDGTLELLGSPPHARGRPAGRYMLTDWSGITPACAGKTRCPLLRASSPRDHPRMRGEDVDYRLFVGGE